MAVAFEACDLANGEGDEGPAALARLRVLVDRASEGRPEGDLVIPVLVRLTEGDARLASEAVVLDLGRVERGLCASFGRASSSEEGMSTAGSFVGAWTGDIGAEIDEGGVGKLRVI